MLDRPGSLAQLLNDIQELRANVVDVEHNRVDAGLRVDEVDIVVHVETRGPEHCATLLSDLAERGYLVTPRGDDTWSGAEPDPIDHVP